MENRIYNHYLNCSRYADSFWALVDHLVATSKNEDSVTVEYVIANSVLNDTAKGIANQFSQYRGIEISDAAITEGVKMIANRVARRVNELKK